MIYGDDQCEECGAARVSGSRLCVGCVVKLLAIRQQEIERLESVKAGLQEKNQKLEDMVCKLLDHIIKESDYEEELRARLAEGCRADYWRKEEI